MIFRYYEHLNLDEIRQFCAREESSWCALRVQFEIGRMIASDFEAWEASDLASHCMKMCGTIVVKELVEIGAILRQSNDF